MKQVRKEKRPSQPQPDPSIVPLLYPQCIQNQIGTRTSRECQDRASWHLRLCLPCLVSAQLKMCVPKLFTKPCMGPPRPLLCSIKRVQSCTGFLWAEMGRNQPQPTGHAPQLPWPRRCSTTPRYPLSCFWSAAGPPQEQVSQTGIKPRAPGQRRRPGMSAAQPQARAEVLPVVLSPWGSPLPVLTQTWVFWVSKEARAEQTSQAAVSTPIFPWSSTATSGEALTRGHR